MFVWFFFLFRLVFAHICVCIRIVVRSTRLFGHITVSVCFYVNSLFRTHPLRFLTSRVRRRDGQKRGVRGFLCVLRMEWYGAIRLFVRLAESADVFREQCSLVCDKPGILSSANALDAHHDLEIVSVSTF